MFLLFPLWEQEQSLHYTADTRTFLNKAATDATAFQAATQKHAAAHNLCSRGTPSSPLLNRRLTTATSAQSSMVGSSQTKNKKPDSQNVQIKSVQGEILDLYAYTETSDTYEHSSKATLEDMTDLSNCLYFS